MLITWNSLSRPKRTREGSSLSEQVQESSGAVFTSTNSRKSVGSPRIQPPDPRARRECGRQSSQVVQSIRRRPRNEGISCCHPQLRNHVVEAAQTCGSNGQPAQTLGVE